MSVFVHHPLGSVGILLAFVGIWISFQNRDPKQSFENTFGGAVTLLGLTISGMTFVTTDVRTDSWSTADWIAGVIIAMSLLCVAFLFGRAYEMRRQNKAGAGEAHRVGTGFSPR